MTVVTQTLLPTAGGKSCTIVADLDNTLLISSSPFPYFALLSFDSGGILRLLFLLLLYPLASFLHHFVSESAGIRVLIFASMSGVKLSCIESTAKAVLPKFYMDDLRTDARRLFSGDRRSILLTAAPRLMVEAFAKKYMGADEVVGTELASFMGRATGFVAMPGVMTGERKAAVIKRLVGGGGMPEMEIVCRRSGLSCFIPSKESYNMITPEFNSNSIRSNNLMNPKAVIFHDGRLVQRPTPLTTLKIILWFPLGLLLSVLRVAAGALLPMKHVLFAFRALGIRIIVNGNPPLPIAGNSNNLFVCSHRTLMDPIFLSAVVRRPVAAVTYSVSCLSEFVAPIRTVRLTRNRLKDAAIIHSFLEDGDLAVCPEGTTSREPFLLRFSALFAELSDNIVPVGMMSKTSMFHGTTARGWKGLDFFYFLMNPRPIYEVHFLDKLPANMTCGSGKSSLEVANYVQGAIAEKLSFQCTSLTRKDKYMTLAGNEGVVGEEVIKLGRSKIEKC